VSEVLAGDTALADALHTTEIDNINLLTAGTITQSGRTAVRNMRDC
jgi:hypothetical protein